MLIPTPIVTLLTAVACKVVCDVFLDDDDSSAKRIIRGHDTITPDMARELIRDELNRRIDNGDDEDDEED